MAVVVGTHGEHVLSGGGFALPGDGVGSSGVQTDGHPVHHEFHQRDAHVVFGRGLQRHAAADLLSRRR